MQGPSEKRLMVVWLILAAVTILSWWLGAEQGDASPSAGVAYAALFIAAAKVRVILGEFMEMRHAPKALQLAMDGWLLLLFGGLALIYGLRWEMPPV